MQLLYFYYTEITLFNFHHFQRVRVGINIHAELYNTASYSVWTKAVSPTRGVRSSEHQRSLILIHVT